MTALALLPLITFSSGDAEARNQYCDRDVCREYTKTIRVNGNVEIARGTACLRDDNRWEIVSLDARRDSARNILQDRIYNDLFNDGLRVVFYDNHSRNYRTVNRNAYRNGYRSAFYYPNNYKKSNYYGKNNYYNQSKNYKRNYKNSRNRY